MSRKIYLFVIHDTTDWPCYAIHEALIEDSFDPYWIGSKPIKVFDNREACMVQWMKLEPKYSGFLDIVNYSDIRHLIDKVDYSENETELNFD